MRISTIFILMITIMLTVVIMQNTGEIKFTLLFADIYMSKAIVLATIAVIAFVAGVLVGRPKKVRYKEPLPFGETGEQTNGHTLSDEDREYIS